MGVKVNASLPVLETGTGLAVIKIGKPVLPLYDTGLGTDILVIIANIPSFVVGYGNNSTARNVFKVEFSQDCSAVAQYELYDSDSFTTNNDIFTGTASNGNKPLLSLVDCTSSAPSSDWKPANAIAGSANPNRMKGRVNYVESQAIPTTTTPLLFNLVLEVPSDLAIDATVDCLLYIRYTFTGTEPILTWYFNTDYGGGTEESPDWAQVRDTTSIFHASSGATRTKYLMEIPISGIADSEKGVIDFV